MAEMVYNDEGVGIETRWAVAYNGALFAEDKDGWNVHSMDTREQAFDLYEFYSQYEDLQFTVIDREYSVSFCNDEWY